ncbi:hypothetical protein B0H66DRAFT_553156, partial [Apodospora peruviana]
MSNYTIQTGLWVNYDSSPALGATLTVSIRWGNYLIAALSSLVAWAGASAWSIVSYSIHQRLAAAQDKDVLHQQLQVHFRTAGSFLDSWLDGFSLHRAWNGRVDRVKRRTLTVSLLALVLFLAFAAAGVFVAEVATKSYQDVLVLAAPNDCGDLVFQRPEAEANHSVWLNEWTAYSDDAKFWARGYAREMYYESHARESAFSMPNLPFIGYEVPCPYTEGISCFGPNRTQGPAWRMDANALDSHVHFGMNAPKEDRVTWSETATCAVVDPQNLTIAPYWRIDNYDGHEINNSYVGILQQFGPDLGYDSNLMFEIPVNLMYERTGVFSQRGLWFPGINDGGGKAITGYPFNRTDADMAMITSTQGLLFYYQPVDDPYFMAHRAATGDEYAFDMNATVYYPSHLFGLMVCTEQQQICNPNTNQCTPWSGQLRLKNAISNNTINLNDAQLATALRIVANMEYVGSMLGMAARGTTNLIIGEKNGVRSGTAMPANQWTREVELWFAANLVAIQNSLLEWVAKPWPQGHPEAIYDFVNSTDLDAKYDEYGISRQKNTLCRNQLIRSSSAVQNFSMLALVLVIVLSVAIIVTGLLLPSCVSHVRERRRRKGMELSAAAESGRVARLADAKYNVLAMALRGAGIDGWERKGTSEIPVTKGSVTVSPRVEKNGLASYPCTACAVCRRPTASSSGSGDSEADSDEKWTKWDGEKKKPALRLDTFGSRRGMSDETIAEKKSRRTDSYKLDRRVTEQTLVASPTDIDETSDGRSGADVSIQGDLDRITSLAPPPPIPARARTRSRWL